ncbi:AAA family ATPase [Sphingomonas asaccharolytica]|uniref:AAA family ATPase n=1 Tax=Sphingomonas asaccharolytica TaxID=40681 RepID=UPI000830F57B|nr:AAA family ATPase [Sphingomonas asaccharolytica]
MSDFFVISGCSGGGKSSLLAALARRGFATIEEPGRRVVREELASGGDALPWVDGIAFARRITALARQDHDAARALPGPVFFDRGLIDAAVALEHLTGEKVLTALAAPCHYSNPVFLAPPWPELFVSDVERRHDFASAVAEYDRLAAAYPALGYEVILLPKVSVAERLAFILERVGTS